MKTIIIILLMPYFITCFLIIGLAITTYPY